MATVKQEIIRIQNEFNATRGQFHRPDMVYEITKVAFERGELIKLLSADDEYVRDADGRLWLATDPKLGPDNDPVDIAGIFIRGIDQLYSETHSEELKNDFVTVFKQMLTGTPEQFYFAIQLYVRVADMESDKSSHFAKYYFEKYSFADELLPFVREAAAQRAEELKTVKCYNAVLYSDGVYGWCCWQSEFYEQNFGLKSFMRS